VQREWWQHRFGCEVWFLAERDTRTNEVKGVELPGASPPGRLAVVESPAQPPEDPGPDAA
jgi:sarcosine oxidase delta subunit